MPNGRWCVRCGHSLDAHSGDGCAQCKCKTTEARFFGPKKSKRRSPFKEHDPTKETD